ncbi:MAG: spore germination protein GerW family protein [Capsulimonas sp.]|uniref:spore germination protein GerW family protein n=1 Tax=Capsulimonas sp. TaxID=2494211 RepID=UPI003264841D
MSDESTTRFTDFADQMLDKLAQSLGGRAGASLVFGDAVERDGVTIIPVAKTRYGFGFGFGAGKQTDEEQGEGGGGGGGVMSYPAGYIEIRDGKAKFRSIGPSPAAIILATIGATIVGSLAVIGWAWESHDKGR